MIPSLRSARREESRRRKPGGRGGKRGKARRHAKRKRRRDTKRGGRREEGGKEQEERGVGINRAQTDDLKFGIPRDVNLSVLVRCATCCRNVFCIYNGRYLEGGGVIGVKLKILNTVSYFAYSTSKHRQYRELGSR